MSDIVERLRLEKATQASMPKEDCILTDLLEEAADEIEKLQCEVDAWVSVICGLCPDRETDKCHLCWKGKERKKHEWISVKDRLPEENENVLAVTDRGVTVCWRHGYFFHSFVRFCEKVSHWMPFPVPPKGEEGEAAE